MITSKDDYTILQPVGRKNNQMMYDVVCNICGHTKTIAKQNILKQSLEHSKKNCKHDFYQMYIGKDIGDFHCTEVVPSKTGYRIRQICNICGHKRTSRLEDAINGSAHSSKVCELDFYNTLIGTQFQDYVVVGVERKANSYDICLKVKCGICGTETIKPLSTIYKYQWSHPKMCTCQSETNKIKTVILKRYQNIHKRCNDPKNKLYQHYGGRGIKCEYTNGFDLYMDFVEEFEKHAAIHGVRNTTFDRIDVNGNYSKDNLRIATQSIQSANTTRQKVFIAQNGPNKVICDNGAAFGRVYGINGGSMMNAVRNESGTAGGWRLVKVLNNEEIAKISEVIEKEGVTTKLLTTSREAVGETPIAVAHSPLQ